MVHTFGTQFRQQKMYVHLLIHIVYVVEAKTDILDKLNQKHLKYVSAVSREVKSEGWN